MARYIFPEDGVLYRAVVVSHKPGEPEKSFTEVYGPYDKPGTAKNVGSWATNRRKSWGRPAEYYIEATQTQWYKVDE